jgi:hypothetical protein
MEFSVQLNEKLLSNAYSLSNPTARLEISAFGVRAIVSIFE